MKKFVIPGLVILIFGILFCVVAYLSPSDTVDFRGEVIGIEIGQDYTVFTLNGFELVQYVVMADEDTVVRYCHEEDGTITLADIKVGDIIQGHFKTWSISTNYAKTIVVQKSETAK